MNILYGLPSEGMGHATRSKVIIAHLISRGHDVRIVTSDRAYTFMEQHFPGKVYSIHGFHFAYKKGKVSKVQTVTQILKTAPRDLVENLQKYKFIQNEFQPDLIISDFETFTAFYAAHNKVPLISIDNIQVIDRCALGFEIPRKERENFHLARNIVKFKVPNPLLSDHVVL